MSRCFPFPPPGYEKKTRNDDLELLAKEKHKEKKHKKEKRDKEKKDKERSKEKHRDKKDRKEKHREKKKDKDREKDKNRTTDEKHIEGRTEDHNEKTGERSQQAQENKDSKFTEELVRRIRDEEKCAGNRMVENFAGTDQRRIEGTGRPKEEIEKRVIAGMDQKRIEGMGRPNEEIEKRVVAGTDQRRIEGTGKPKEETEKRIITGTDQRRIEGTGKPKEETEKRVFASVDQRRIEGTGRPKEEIEKRVFVSMDQRRVDGTGRPKEEIEKRVEGKEKFENKEGHGKKADRRKDRDRDRDREEKRTKGKNKERDKEKEKEKVKVKEKGDHKHKEHDKHRKSDMDQIDPLSIKATLPTKESEKNSVPEGNLRKRKEPNGFLHDNYMPPNKLPRPAYPTHLQMENGRKVLETCHTPIPCVSERERASDNKKIERVIDNKEHKVNGKIEARPSSINSRSTADFGPSGTGGESSKPPHPDSQYLSQILTIPKMEEWSDFDDQEWLFGNNNFLSKRKPAADVDGRVPQVWAETLRIKEGDIYALPYVFHF